MLSSGGCGICGGVDDGINDIKTRYKILKHKHDLKDKQFLK